MLQRTKTVSSRRSRGPKAPAPVRVGIGGWTYAPWNTSFYPPDLPKAKQLAHASRCFGTIEVNGTFYRTQKPATFAKWRDETPEGFVFTLKASRYATHRRVLAEAGESIERFVASGIAELGPKLGPIVWQFAPTKAFDAADFGAFLALLPKRADGLMLRHAMEVRHESFRCAAYLALARKHGVATVFTDSPEHPSFADRSGDFVYARLMCAQSRFVNGYAPKALDRWAEVARRWARGEEPEGLPRVEALEPAQGVAPREVYVFFINGAKERAPAAAYAMQRRLKTSHFADG